LQASLWLNEAIILDDERTYYSYHCWVISMFEFFIVAIAITSVSIFFAHLAEAYLTL